MIKNLVLKEIARRTVKQSATHKKDMTAYFRTLVEAARNEFTEEPPFSLDCFLTECFNEALKK